MNSVNNKNTYTLNWIYKVSGKKKLYIFFLSIIQILLNLGSIGYAIVFKGVTDTAVGKKLDSFIIWIVTFIALALFQICMGALNRYLTEYSKASLENCFKERLFSNILSRNYQTISDIHSGEWMNRLTSDTVVVSDGITQIIPGLLGMLTRLSGAFIVLLILCPILVGILFLGGILIGVFACVFRKKLKNMHKLVQEKDGSVRVFLQEMISSLIIVKAFSAEDKCTWDARKHMTNHKVARVRKSNLSNVCMVGFNSAMNAAYIVGAAIGGYGIISGTMSYGSLMAIIQLIGQLQAPFSGITSYMPQYYAMLASAERLMEIEQFEMDIPSGSILPSDMIKDIYEHKLNGIRLEDVCFGYLPDNMVLNHVSLGIAKGEYIAFTGHSGCGKSTLLKLLIGLYIPDVGNISFILNENKIWQLSPMYRHMFAYVPQGNMLMSGTIRDVVAFGRNPEDEEIWSALETAMAAFFVRELPRHLDTVLGERGAGLSEGQLQRIAIARAVYSESPILLLDEATSALDEATEYAVLENLRTMTDKTVLIVTHRRAALEICDRVVRFSKNGITVTKLNKDDDTYGKDKWNI